MLHDFQSTFPINLEDLFLWQSCFSAEGRSLRILQLQGYFNRCAPASSPPGSFFMYTEKCFWREVFCFYTEMRTVGLNSSSGLQAALISCLLFFNLTLSQKQIQQQHPFYKFCAKKWLFLRTLSQEMIPQEESIEHWYLSKLLWYSLQGQGRKNQAKQLFRQGIFLAAILSSGCVVSFHPDQRQREHRPGVL